MPHMPWMKTLQQLANGPATRCDFVVGSCLYPGTPFEENAASEIFLHVAEVLREERGGDALFLVGDLIYADATAGMLDPLGWRDRYLLRYRRALGMPALRDLLRQVPTHFVVDDHEFTNNFAGPSEPPPAAAAGAQAWRTNLVNARIRQGALDSASGPDSPDSFDFAQRMAASYLHPGSLPWGNAPQGRGRALWYTLAHGREFPCPAFLADTRSERLPATTQRPARLMHPDQKAALKDWLTAVKPLRLPKFIFSGSTLVPLERTSLAPGGLLREDGLAAFGDDMGEILRHIVEQDIHGVVFVGGDLHLSATAELTLRAGGHAVQAVQIVASGLYSPLRFVNADVRQYAWEVPQRLQLAPLHGGAPVEIDYTARLLCPTPHQHATPPSFVQVQADPAGPGHTWQLRVVSHQLTANNALPAGQTSAQRWTASRSRKENAPLVLAC